MSFKIFTKNIGILGITQILLSLSNIVMLPIITKLLGAENYGIWTQLLVTIGLVSPFAVIGLPYTLVRFLPGEKDLEKTRDGIWSVFTIILGISILVCSIFVYFSLPISKLFNCDKIFIQILPFIIMFSCLNSAFSSVFRAYGQIKEYCSFSLFEKLGETTLAITAIFLGYKLLGVILSVLIMQSLTFLVMGSLIIKRIGIKFPKFIRIKEYLTFGSPSILGDISSWVVQASDKYFVGFFLGTLFVGYYAPAYTLGGAVGFVMSPLIFLLPATLSKHYDDGEIDKVKTYLKYSLKYFLVLAIPAFFGLNILSKQLLTIFSTPEIAQYSYHIVPFISLSILLYGAYAIIVQILVLKKKTHVSGSIWLIAAVLNFGLNFILIPIFGILGASITTLIAYAFAFSATYYYSFKEMKFEIDWTSIFKNFLATTLMSLLVIAFWPIGSYKTILAIIIGIIVYGIMTILLKTFSKKETIFLKELFKKT
ncbi:MAG: flippase [Candidatus Staskawiczbacteria bacterium]